MFLIRMLQKQMMIFELNSYVMQHTKFQTRERKLIKNVLK